MSLLSVLAFVFYKANDATWRQRLENPFLLLPVLAGLVLGAGAVWEWAMLVGWAVAC